MIINILDKKPVLVAKVGSSVVNPAGALLISNRLNEFAANPVAQEEAQSNLGLGGVDPVAYYILSKS